MAQQLLYKKALISLHIQERSVHKSRLKAARNLLYAASNEALADALLLRAPQRFIGPFRVCEIEGKGRGVVATEAIRPGQLLLCCSPLGVVTGPQQASLAVEQLQVALAECYNGTTHLWLQQLYDGSDTSTLQQLDFQRPLQHQRHQQPTHPASSCSGSGAELPDPLSDAVLQQLMDVVRYDAYGDHHDDLAAAALTGAEPVALLGLWPEFSLINHSCAPNAINWVLPGVNRAMVVRAARHIAAGDEVTISYLGGPQLLPLDGRQEALSSAFGFACSCPRCRAEEDIPDSLAQLLQDTVSRVGQSFAPTLRRAIEADDRQQLLETRQQAAAMMTLLYQQMRRHLVHPMLRDQLLSSCYNCLEAIADADVALGDRPAAAASLSKCLKAAAAVTPGSDLHVIVASKLEALQRELHGQGSMQAQQAWQECIEAHHLRYGKLGSESILRLAELNRTLYV